MTYEIPSVQRRVARPSGNRQALRLPEASHVLELFQKADADQNGYIDAQELETVLKTLNPNISSDHCRRMFQAADLDGDNRVNYGEFIEWIFSGKGAGDGDDGITAAMLNQGKKVLKGLELKTADPNFDTSSIVAFNIDEELKKGLSNAYKSFCKTYPDSADIAEAYVKKQVQRLQSKEFEEGIVKSFEKRLDKDGNGTLSYYEVRDMIREVLSADTNSTVTQVPSEVEIQEFFNMYDTDAFGSEMGHAEFLNLMRAINIHLIKTNLPTIQKLWRRLTKDGAGQRAAEDAAMEAQLERDARRRLEHEHDAKMLQTTDSWGVANQHKSVLEQMGGTSRNGSKAAA